MISKQTTITMIDTLQASVDKLASAPDGEALAKQLVDEYFELVKLLNYILQEEAPYDNLKQAACFALMEIDAIQIFLDEKLKRGE